MKVKCLYNSNEKFFKKKYKYQFHENYETELIIGKKYNVYGLFYHNDKFKYLIFDENNMPFWYLNKLFEILDNKISQFWYLKFLKEEYLMHAIWGYYELVNDEYHNDDLMKENKDYNEEKEKKALEIFLKRKKEIDMEFPDWCIKVTGQIIDSKTLKCPICGAIWESNSIFGMVECPKCKTIMHNPKYKK
jgi:rubrerythrin